MLFPSSRNPPPPDQSNFTVFHTATNSATTSMGWQARHTIVPAVIGEGIVCAIGVWLGRIGAN